MKLINVKQGTPEWLLTRLGRFTASDAQAIANNGKGLETLVFEKVAERLTGKKNSEYTNEDMERGHELEEMARASYELETNNQVKEVGFAEMSGFVGCSPDGFVGEDGLVEFKCPNNVNFTRFLYTGKIDPKYEWQMQMQMLVCEKKWCDYVIFNENFEPNTKITRVEANKEMQLKITNGLTKGLETLKEIWKKIGREQ